MDQSDVYLVDCDEILADCVNPMLDVVQVIEGTRYLKKDMKSWDFLASFDKSHLWPELKKYASRPGFCRSFPVLPGAQEGFKQLEQLPGTVVVVTSPLDTPNWTMERSLWLKEHFGVEKDRIIYTSAKQYIAGKCLVDDKFTNVSKWRARNQSGVGFLWEAPYNIGMTGEGIIPVSSWEHVIEEIKKL